MNREGVALPKTYPALNKPLNRYKKPVPAFAGMTAVYFRGHLAVLQTTREGLPPP
jgi:hypothetical protein